MAKNEPSKPDDVKASPENATPAEEQTVPATAPTEIAGEHIPAPGDVVVPFEKINEIISEKKATAKEAEKASSADKAPPGKAEPQTGDSRQKREKPLAETEQKNKPKSSQSKTTEKADNPPSHSAKPEKAPKSEKPEKPDKRKQATEIGGGDASSAKPTEQAQQEAAPPAPELPPEPKEAPRSNEPEQIVYLKLSDLHAFKDHPFGVRDDEEMRAMVESVKDKGVTQPAIVRPREDGGYEIVSVHRRQKASEPAGFADMLCISRFFLNDAIPEEHKSGIDMSRDLLRRSHVVVVCGNGMNEDMKNDIAITGRLNITATTLDAIF